ncbi:MAG: hypothetical protein ABJ275_08590 [Maricaulaceae bacterium]
MSIFQRLFLFICFALLSTACSTTGDVSAKVLQINSLDSPRENTGEFKGLEFLADPVPGQLKNRVNIMYMHGIGWTEDRSKEQLANSFIAGLADAYGLDVKENYISSLCGESDYDKRAANQDFIYIRNQTPEYLETIIPNQQLRLDQLACMDRTILQIGDNLEFAVYRVFWDEIFWNELQFAHVGQDDNQGSSQELAGLRRKYNRILKDDLVNYGFSDAVMYLGPAGAQIRRAVKGAMCSAALDAAGFSFKQQGASVSQQNVCSTADNTSLELNQFAFVTESLGSKIMFDLMQDAQQDGKDTAIDDLIAGTEVYMLANQLALLSLSDLSMTPRLTPPPSASTADRPRLVAMSEINDFLTYELIPFIEQVHKRSFSNGYATGGLHSVEDRKDIIEKIGFDMVDVRLEFADKLVPVLKGFVDPKDAHSGHASEEAVMKLILCGAKNGQPNSEGCLAGVDNDD